MTKERNEERLDKKLLVNIGQEGFEGMGLTTNISQNGMSITTTDILPVNSKVTIQIGIGDETFSLEGEIMWNKDNSGSPSDNATVETGIKIMEAPAQYAKCVEKFLAGN